MDDDIEEAADHQSEQSGGEGKSSRIGEQSGISRRSLPTEPA
jgi:hypothetical protein